MAKQRQPLSFDTEGLAQDIKQSMGQGVDVFFPSTAQPEIKPKTAPTTLQSVQDQEKEQKQTKRSVRPYVRTDDTAVRTDNMLDIVPPTPSKRRPERYAFQFWEDQITRLKQLRKVLNLNKDAEDREEVSLSDMIREAVDDFIKKKTEQIKKNVRTDE